MLAIGNIRDNFNGFDEVYYIVRSFKGKTDDTHKWVPTLSPSWDLFKYYLDLKNQNKFDYNTFLSGYVPRFLQEMQSPEAQKWLNYLVQVSRTKNIALTCFCTDEKMCHRSIIHALLDNMGADIRPAKIDYKKIYL